jgi:hypothetical protein
MTDPSETEIIAVPFSYFAGFLAVRGLSQDLC